MKNRFAIYEVVENVKTLSTYVIKDYEVIDDKYVYYFTDGTCNIEENIDVKGMTAFKRIISIPPKEFNRQVDDAFSFLNDIQ